MERKTTTTDDDRKKKPWNEQWRRFITFFVGRVRSRSIPLIHSHSHSLVCGYSSASPPYPNHVCPNWWVRRAAYIWLPNCVLPWRRRCCCTFCTKTIGRKNAKQKRKKMPKMVYVCVREYERVCGCVLLITCFSFVRYFYCNGLVLITVRFVMALHCSHQKMMSTQFHSFVWQWICAAAAAAAASPSPLTHTKK